MLVYLGTRVYLSSTLVRVKEPMLTVPEGKRGVHGCFYLLSSGAMSISVAGHVSPSHTATMVWGEVRVLVAIVMWLMYSGYYFLSSSWSFPSTFASCHKVFKFIFQYYTLAAII